MHVIYIPFLTNWWLYTTGLAASCVSMIAYVGAVYFLYHLGAMLTRTSWGGVVSAAPLALHPGVIYLGVCPMTELPFLALMCASVYYLCVWTRHGRGLWAAAVLCCLAGLVRYSGWYLAAAETLVVLGLTWRRHGWARALERGIAFGAVAALAVPIFLVHTWHVTGSPWSVMQGIHGATPPGEAIAGQGLAHACARLGKWFTESVGFSPWLAVAVVAAFTARCGWRARWVGAWTLLVPLACVCTSVIWGLPPRSRYATLLLPVLGVMGAGALTLRHRWCGPVLAALVVLVVGARNLYLQNGPLAEALWHPEHLPRRQAALAYLHRHHDGRPILIAGGMAPEMYDLRIPLKHFITDTHNPLYEFVSRWHTHEVGWIIVRHGDDLHRLYRDHPEKLDGFLRVFAQGKWEVWCRGEAL